MYGRVQDAKATSFGVTSEACMVHIFWEGTVRFVSPKISDFRHVFSIVYIVPRRSCMLLRLWMFINAAGWVAALDPLNGAKPQIGFDLIGLVERQAGQVKNLGVVIRFALSSSHSAVSSSGLAVLHCYFRLARLHSARIVCLLTTRPLRRVHLEGDSSTRRAIATFVGV